MRSKKSATTLAAALAEAKTQAADLGDRIGPAVEEAKDRIGPLVDDARGRLAPVLDDARTRLTPVVGPVVGDARERLTPVVEDARQRLTPVVEDAMLRLADLGDAVAAKLDDATPAPAAKHSGGSRLKKLLVVAGVGGLAALAAKRLREGPAEPQWRSTPPGRTAPATSDTASSAEGAGVMAAPAAVASMVAADSPDPDAHSGDVPGDGVQSDPGGGSPDEAASDAADGPHTPTTPDAPAERIDLTE
ncbi:MAG: hypothetical protein AVDCRST_MAG34-1502 [uncultured Nocardioidaceae bacterium]|uniref:Uncharacterized protein n=1 Tax=uncultured Nocardioidaceae bacterium TaxID=253824 RepID=A0A6J4L489_9ACTN|nr:MAG: hypothetical protein AVDCRST_MAG34-1502 [uncultured Nocardioidaceae bacterium]